MNWVCDNAWKGPFSQSMFFTGAIIGCIIFGWTSDNFGRLPTLLATNLILGVAGICLPLCENMYCFTTVRFLMGLTFNTFFVAMQILGGLNVFLASFNSGLPSMTSALRGEGDGQKVELAITLSYTQCAGPRAICFQARNTSHFIDLNVRNSAQKVLYHSTEGGTYNLVILLGQLTHWARNVCQ